MQRAAHHNLAWHYLHQNKHEEAIAHCRKSLQGKLKPPIEALYRMRLADCLEASGDIEGARIEKQRSEELVKSSPESLSQLMALGASLKKQGRYVEAIPVFERALARTPESLTMPRAHIMANLTIACWEASQISDTLRWADAALALNPGLTHRMACLSMSGLALGNLGRLDEAEERHRLAYEAAEAAGNKDQAARHLAMVGETHRRRGKLVEAIETCERAASMSIANRRTARYCEYEAFMSWGRFSEAREMLEQGRKSQGFAVPASERRIQAVARLTLGNLEMEEGNREAALVCVEDAREELENDEKMCVSYHSFRAWVEAAMGLSAESLESARRAQELSVRISGSRGSLLTYRRNLGCAALMAGDVSTARAHWQAYLDLKPDPVDAPKAHYYLGECCKADGDEDGARHEWQAAVDSGLETLYVNRAKVRLAEPISVKP